MVDRGADSYRIKFGKTGTPNAAGLPAWPVFKDGEPTAMYLQDTPHTGPVPHADKLTLTDEYFAWKRKSGDS
jgi:para-nitrobenzyl esterase